MIKHLATYAAALLVAGAASSATLTYGPTMNGLEGIPISQSMSFDLFDPTLGTLTSAKLTVHMASLTFAEAVNIAGQGGGSQTGMLGGSLDFSILSPNGIDVGLLNFTPQEVTVGEGDDAFLTFVGTGEFFFTFSDPLSLQGFGQFGIDCLSANIPSYTSDNLLISVTDQGDGSASCNATLEYTYTENSTPVPEPGTLALMGLALAGLAAGARRRKTA